MYFARNHRDRVEHIDVVTIGAPQVGDADFNRYAASQLNMRRIAYLGSGQRPDVQETGSFSYGIGDAIPLLPLACPNLKMPGASVYAYACARACAGTRIESNWPREPHAKPPTARAVCWGLDFVQPTAEGIDTFDYDVVAGNVPFYASDMQNVAGWRRKEDFVFGARSNDEISEGIFATHLCESVIHAVALSPHDPDR